MRLPTAVFAAVLLAPASAQASVVGLEGTQLVFRADPGERVSLISGIDARDVVFFSGKRVRPGPGCVAGDNEVTCAHAGVTGVTIVTGDGNDTVAHWGRLPVTMALGAGDDKFHGQSESVTVDAGPGDDDGLAEGRQLSVVGGDGDDDLRFQLADHAEAPLALDGGAGRDVLVVEHTGPNTTLPGGERRGTLPPVAITCGPGADRWVAGPLDVPGEGCAGHIAGITTKTVSRAFREGALTTRASGSVTLKRRVGLSEEPREKRETIARGVFTAEPGPLRVSLKRTVAGTRWLRRTPRLPVFVTIRTRSGADRGEVTFRSRIG